MFVRETSNALRLGLATQWAQPRHALLIAAGFAIAIPTLATLLAIPAGLDRLGAATGRDDIALVLGATASDETASSVAPADAALIATLPGIAHDADGKPMIATQFVATATLKRRDGAPASVLLRGIDANTLSMLDSKVHINAGTLFKSGTDELIAGATAARAFVALENDDRLRIRDSVWRVSGRFSAPGLWESELWVDISSLQAAYNASNRVSELWVRLTSPTAFDTFAKALKSDKRLGNVRAERQRSYYAGRTGFLGKLVRVAAFAIAATLGTGAALAIANAIGIALMARQRQLAILRAVGFAGGSLFLTLLIEVLIIAALVAVFVLACVRLCLNGMEIGSSTGDQSIAFTLEVAPAVVLWTFVYALILALASAWWPSLRALRAPLAIALRDDY
jgi:putative ABC transport system permease protein